MTRQILVVILLVWISATAEVLGEPQANYFLYPNASLEVQRLVAGHYHQSDPDAFNRFLHDRAPLYDDKEIGATFKRFSQEMRNLELGIHAFEAGQQILEGSLKAGQQGTIGPGGLMVYAAISYGIHAQLEYVKKEMISAGESSARNALQARLAQWRNESSSRTLADFKGKTADQIFADLYGQGHPLLTVDLAKVDPRATAVATGFLLKSIQDLIVNQKLNELQFRALQHADQKKMEEQLAAVSEAMSEFQSKTSDDLKNLVNGQVEIRQGLKELGSDIAFLQEFTFGRMSAKEQIQALEAGLFEGSMDQQAREDLLKKVQLVKKREELLNTFKDTIDLVNVAANIAEKHGVSREVVDALRQGVSIGSAAVSALTAIASQRYIGAVVAIAGLFGEGGGPDIASERHAQIVGMLEEILKGQEQILKELAEVRRELHMIMKNQQRIFEAVIALGKQIDENHRQLIERLAEIREQLYTITLLQRADLRAPIEECREAARYRPEYGYTGGREHETLGIFIGGHFSSMDHLYRHFSSYDGAVVQCLGGLRSLLNPVGPGYNPLFLLRTYDENASDTAGAEAVINDARKNSQAFRTKHFGPFIDFVWGTLRNNAQVTQRDLAQLAAPAPTVDLLDSKRRVGDLKPTWLWDRGFESRSTVLRDYLNSMSIEEFAALLLEYHYYFQILKNTAKPELYPIRELDPKDQLQGRKLLLNLLEITNIAIAQRVLLSGDVLIPELYEAYTDKGTSAEDKHKIVGFLEKLPLFRKNFVLYGIWRQLRERKIAVSEYYVALTLPSSERLAEMLASSWELVPDAAPGDSKPRRIRIGSVKEPLPTADELLSGKLILPKDVDTLLAVRSSLAEAVVSYELDKIVGADGQELISWLVAKSVAGSQSN